MCKQTFTKCSCFFQQRDMYVRYLTLVHWVNPKVQAEANIFCTFLWLLFCVLFFIFFSLVVCLFCFRVLSSWKQIMSFPLFFSSENKLMHAPFKTHIFSQMIDYLRVIQFKIPSIVCVCVCGYVYIRWPKINLIINYTI